MQNKLKEMQARLGLSEKAMSAFLGVPVFTYRKWINASRVPNASAIRLVELLELLEVMAPSIVDQLVKDAQQ